MHAGTPIFGENAEFLLYQLAQYLQFLIISSFRVIFPKNILQHMTFMHVQRFIVSVGVNGVGCLLSVPFLSFFVILGCNI